MHVLMQSPVTACGELSIPKNQWLVRRVRASTISLDGDEIGAAWRERDTEEWGVVVGDGRWGGGVVGIGWFCDGWWVLSVASFRVVGARWYTCVCMRYIPGGLASSFLSSLHAVPHHPPLRCSYFLNTRIALQDKLGLKDHFSSAAYTLDALTMLEPEMLHFFAEEAARHFCRVGAEVVDVLERCTRVGYTPHPHSTPP